LYLEAMSNTYNHSYIQKQILKFLRMKNLMNNAYVQL
jgi:hypothetical protein